PEIEAGTAEWYLSPRWAGIADPAWARLVHADPGGESAHAEEGGAGPGALSGPASFAQSPGIVRHLSRPGARLQRQLRNLRLQVPRGRLLIPEAVAPEQAVGLAHDCETRVVEGRQV